MSEQSQFTPVTMSGVS